MQVKLNTRLTPADLEQIRADAVILATGSVPIAVRDLPGKSGSGISMATPEEVLTGQTGSGARHAVVSDEGGGRNGLAAAEVLAEAGVRVTLVTGDQAIADHVDGTVNTQLYRFLLQHGVTFRPMETITGLANNKVVTRNIYTGEAGEIADPDLLVDWQGNRVVSDLEAAVRARFSQVETVGDSLAPRTVQIATAEGADAARRIGRQASSDASLPQ